ncbi:hypothetical protein EDB89DRAFT_2070348 [Lactarius sanguifluus]|nr:hypothetical protein EDB89DRAFT_2070348 [Lactarius sanguifluus]
MPWPAQALRVVEQVLLVVEALLAAACQVEQQLLVAEAQLLEEVHQVEQLLAEVHQGVVVEGPLVVEAVEVQEALLGPNPDDGGNSGDGNHDTTTRRRRLPQRLGDSRQQGGNKNQGGGVNGNGNDNSKTDDDNDQDSDDNDQDGDDNDQDGDGDGYDHDYDYFVQAYTDTAECTKAWKSLQTLTMKGEDIDTYIAAFSNLTHKAGYNPDEATTLEMFQDGLPNQLVINTMHFQHLITWDDWKAAAHLQQAEYMILKDHLGKNKPQRGGRRSGQGQEQWVQALN